MPKINKILFVETKSRFEYPYQNWFFPLKRHCKEIISFDPKYNNLVYGKEIMNKNFLDLIKKEKPDYIFLWVVTDRYSFDVLLKIREVSPKTQVFMILQDDDTEFENYSRFYILFADYGLIFHKNYIKRYKEQGSRNVFYSAGIDPSFFKFLNIKKKYDVTFIGCPKTKATQRYEYIKFLKEKGVKIKLFGWGWEDYPDLKDIYGGVLDADKMIEVLNQSKIHLNLTKNGFGEATDLKSKIFEGGACKTFVLTEYCEAYLDLFKEGKEMIMFKDKEDLLKKIRYYLKNEKERKKIEEAAYKKIMSTYNLDIELDRIFKRIDAKNKNSFHEKLPKINKKIISLSKDDLNLNLDKIKNKLKNYDYIFFKGNYQNLKYRKYLQAYSLEKTGKQISCCDYFSCSKILKDYLHFAVYKAFRNMQKKEFESFLIISQLMVTKDYFLENIKKFKDIFNNGRIDFIKDKNTVFVSFPLIRVSRFAVGDYALMKKGFYFKFLYELYSLKARKKIFLSPYVYMLFLEIFKGKRFILDAIVDTMKDEVKSKKLDSLKKT